MVGTFTLVFVGAKWAAISISLIAPPLGAVLGRAVHAVVVKGDTDLRGSLDQLRTDAGGGQA